MAVSRDMENSVPSARPVITTYLSSEFYKAAFQWLAEKDDRSMAWMTARLIENQVDTAISKGEIPAEIVQKLKEDVGEDE